MCEEQRDEQLETLYEALGRVLRSWELRYLYYRRLRAELHEAVVNAIGAAEQRAQLPHTGSLAELMTEIMEGPK